MMFMYKGANTGVEKFWSFTNGKEWMVQSGLFLKRISFFLESHISMYTEKEKAFVTY